MKNIVILIMLINFAFAKVIGGKQIITIDHGVLLKIPVAINPVIGSDINYCQYINQIIRQDLSNCGLINCLAEKSYTQRLISLSETPQYSVWKSIGAHFLSVTSLVRADNKFRADLKTYDVIIGQICDHYIISSSITGIRSLGHAIADKIYFRVTGDKGYFNNKIVFVKELPNYRKRICMMDIDGYNEIPLVSGTRIYLSPRLSPDGKTLVYFSYKRGYSRYRGAGKDLKGEVFIMNIKEGKVRPLELPGNSYMSYAPRFSPDGDSLVFSLAESSGGSSIFRYDINTGNLQRLTRSVARSIDTSPCYSPDGKNIVFNSDRSSTQQIYIMNADGGNLRRISFGAGRYATPVWSPRGDFIAFARITEGEFYIGLMRADGSGERMIARGFMVENPAWVKNGRVLLYTKLDRRGGRYSINLVDVTGNYNRIVKKDASDPDISSI